ncbi:CHAT domain-containing protein [Frigidibacter sp. ROC022]|uniref:CHAT domain-containing protein n=1 Tax=Frigidibacter sp. ROC022 TaxID=2971796 RepID=UPI00215B6743|nr:CHAT domain-containing protein [Frigidibacter sp. ROC022]MCR8726185.1 CHAT domain-containing protein [Frigidibacter sp. ROC022]
MGLARVCLLSAAAPVVAQDASASAPPSQIDAWASVIDSQTCGWDLERSDLAGEFDYEDLMLFALSWGDLGAEQLAGWVEAGMTDYLLRGGHVGRMENARDWVEYFLAQLGPARDRMQAEAEALGPALCPMQNAIAADSLARFAAADREKPGRYRTHYRLAQEILAQHGCLEGEIDGAFGPVSRTAWNKAIRQASRTQQDAARKLRMRGTAKPTPGEVVQLAALQARGGLCAEDPEAPLQDSRAALALAAECAAGRDPRDGTMALVRPFLIEAARSGPAHFSSALASLRRFCARPDLWSEPGGTLPAFLVEGLPPVSGLQARDRARLLVEALMPDPEAPPPANPIERRDMVLGLGWAAEQALQRPEVAAHPDTAVALLGLVLDLPGELSVGEVSVQLDLIAAGIDSYPLDPELRADIIRRYNARGLAAHNLRSRQVRAARFLQARDDGTGAGELAAGLVAMANAGGDSFFVSQAYGGYGDVPDGLIRVEATLTFDGLLAMNQLATLTALWPEARQAVIDKADPFVAFATASLMLEGYAEAPKSPELVANAIGLIAHAAGQGLGLAQLRYAQALEQGYGVAADPQAALAQYRAAADSGQPAAHLALAGFYERGIHVPQDWLAAERHWRAGLGLDPEPGSRPWVEGLAQVRAGRAAGRPFFTEGPGAELSAAARERLRDWVAEEDYRAFDGQDTARRMGLAYMAPDAGLAPDFAEAAEWFRLALEFASDREQGAPASRAGLAHILLARPDLKHPDEDPVALLDGTLEGMWLRQHDPLRLARHIESGCSFEIADCVTFQHRAAVGGIDPALIAPAHDWLRAAAAAEAEARKTVPEFEPIPTAATEALLDVQSFFGDFAGARATVATLPRLALAPGYNGGLDQPRFATRNAAFRRIVSRIVGGGTPQDMDGFRALLAALGAHGDRNARGFLELVGDPDLARRPETSSLTLEQARRAYDIAEPLGRESRGLAFAARRLSTLEAAAGQGSRALELELIAMGSDLARAETTAVLDGALPADLTRVCAWSTASERLAALGQGEMALSLARRAVNRLQGIRASLAGLPEHLQLCFRDQVSDHYRWLADLLIRQGHPAEADRVLMMLKSFETYRFADRDPALRSDSLDRLPETAEEQALVTRLGDIAPTVTGQALRRRELLLLSRDRALSEAETAELSALDAALAAGAAERDAQLASLVAAVKAQGQSKDARQLAAGATIKRHLRALAGRRAAALQYVVLPDRIGLILTTPVSQRAFVLDRIGGEPLSAEALSASVDSLRAALRDPASDPRPAARQLGNLLLPPEAEAELQAAGIDTLILSPDGPLRYLPFAALRNDAGWLVESYALSLATEARIGGPGQSLTRIAAFGAAQGGDGFAPLPGVRRELAALVRTPDSDTGLLDGVALLDAAFTRAALARSLVFGDAFAPEFGILHIASHFHLGASEDDSFLLLGDGSRLTVSDLRDGFGVDLDFSEVGLLTLSACDTGYGLPGADGSELESFAAIAQDEGARAVLATLWPVADGATAAFMEGLYARQLASDAPALDLALAETQRSFLDTDAGSATLTLRGGIALKPRPSTALFPGYSHPFFWAPVILLQGAS